MDENSGPNYQAPFWPKLHYGEREYASFRNVFLEHYRASCRKSEFDVFESAYHIYTALDFLIFSQKTGDREMESRLKNCLDGMARYENTM